MFSTNGADTITSVTHVRTDLPDIIKEVQDGKSILVQRNGEPVVVLLSLEEFREYKKLLAEKE